MDIMLESRQDLMLKRELELQHQIMQLQSRQLHQQFELLELRLTLRFGWMMAIGCFVLITAVRL